MLANLTIRARLIIVIAFLLLVSALIGTASLMSLTSTNESLKTVYEDRLVALDQLDRVIRSMDEMQIALSLGLISDEQEVHGYLSAFEKAELRRDKVWQEYLATYLTPDEAALAKKLQSQQKLLNDKGFLPTISALKSNDEKAAASLLRQDVQQYAAAVKETMNSLISLQSSVAKDEYEASQERYQSFRSISILGIMCAVFVGAAIGAWLIQSINKPLSVAINAAQRLAEGDLTQKIEISSTNEMGRLLRAFGEMITALTASVRQVRHSTESITNASGEIASGNLDLSSRTEQQAASLEETASSMEELTSTVRQNADNAREANALMAQARQQAEDGGGIVGKVVSTMNDIKQSSSQMAEIINVIDGIAFQTNILALNAAVEAARAGEQGRGFAVVASEVRGLAQRSASAAKEIRELIEDTLNKIQFGGGLAIDAGAAMEEAVTSVKRVAALMENIASASQEQSDGIDQINIAVGQMDQTTQQNAALVEEAAAAASSLRDQAGHLANAVSVFKIREDHQNLIINT